VRCPRTVLAWGESSVVSQTWLIEVPPALAPARTSYNVCRDLDILAEVYRKFLVEAVDDTIKQVLFLYLALPG